MMKEAIPYQPEQDSIDWRTSWRRVKHAVSRHIPLILASVGCALLLLFAYIKIFPPIYRGEVIVQGELNEDVVRSNYYSAWNVFRKGDLKSEPELITSAKVSREVVKELNLKFNDVHHTFLTQIAYLWTDSWLGKSWRKFKEWLFPPDPAAYKATPEEIEFARTIDAFKEGVTVEFITGTAIAKIVVKAPTFRAAEFANKVADVYLAQRNKAFQDEGATAYNSLVEEVTRARNELTELDQQKFDFDMKNKVVLDFEKDKLQVGTWNALKVSINETRATIASLEASLETVKQQLAKEPPEIVSARTLQDSKTKGLMEGREFELNATLQHNRERYAADSPEVKLLEKSIAENRESLQKQPDRVEVGQQVIMNPIYAELRQKEQSLSERLAAARAMLAAKSAPLAEVEKRLDVVPALVRNVVEQARIRDGLELRYKVLRDRAMQADISRATVGSAPASVRVLDYATPPMKASWPKNLILLPSALALGLVIGLALALLAEVFSTQVNRDRLASRPDIPVYAVIDLRPEGLLALPDMSARDSRAVVDRLRRLA